MIVVTPPAKEVPRKSEELRGPDSTATNTIRPLYLAIHLTYRCPAKCDHCCFSSGPEVDGHLDFEMAARAIEEAANITSLKMVGFTGGEPMLYPRQLAKLITNAKAFGLSTRVVTSAAWAKTPSKTDETICSLKRAGLNELSLSYDDSHATYIPRERVLNCVRAAKQNDISVAFNVCVDVDSTITATNLAAWMKDEGINLSGIRIQETLINATGRAATSLPSDRTDDSRRLVGPCDHALRGPTLTANGDILPCCGTIPFHEGLSLGKAASTTIPSALAAGYNSMLLRWIAFEGPASIVEQATAETPVPISAESFDSNCAACAALMSNVTILSRAREMAATTKKASLDLQTMIYTASGLYEPPSAWLAGDDDGC